MEQIIDIISANPVASVIILIFIVSILLFFTFKAISKLVLIAFVIFAITLGYFYYQDPDKVRDYCKSMLSGITDLSDKRKSFLDDGKQLFDKTKGAPNEVNKLLDASKKELSK